MDIEDKLKTLEPMIRGCARRYSSLTSEIDDFEQIARIKVWKELEKDPNRDIRYLSKVAKNSILSNKNANNAQKRKPVRGITSLNAPLGEEEGFTLEDTLGKRDNGSFIGESSFEIIDLMRAKYGRFYINGIKNETKPRKIVRRLLRGIIEEIERLPKNEIPTKVDYTFFVDRGLQPLLWAFYDNSPFEAVVDAFEGEILPWDFKRKPQGFWKGKRGYKNATRALKWFCEKNKILTEKDCFGVTTEDFENSGLGGMLQKVFSCSPYLALKYVFLNLRSWDMKTMSKRELDLRENCKFALDTFLSEKGILPLSNLNAEETYEQGVRLVVTRKALEDFGLSGLVARYDRSPYKLFREFYPSQILPWTILGSKEAWKENPKQTAAYAIRWLFDRYLRIPVRDIPEYASCDLFWNVGFSGIMTNREIGFNSSPYKAVDNAYPNTFSKEEFSRYREVKYLNMKELIKSRK